MIGPDPGSAQSTQNQGQGVVQPNTEAKQIDQKCYARYGKTNCVKFPYHPKSPCNPEFVYHGKRGELECIQNK